MVFSILAFAAQNLARELADHAAIGAAFELLHKLGHDLSHIGQAAGAQLANRRFHLRSQLIGGQLARQGGFKNSRPRPLPLRPIFPAPPSIQLDRLALAPWLLWQRFLPSPLAHPPNSIG